MAFDIEINKTQIEQALLNIEDRTRTNIFAWNGQFSPQFIEVMIKNYGCDRIYDPFMGCGTVLGEASRLGYSAFGIELNVAPFYMSCMYKFANMDMMERNNRLFELDEVVTDLDSILACDDEIFKCLVVLMDLYNNEFSFELMLNKWNKLKELIIHLPYSTGAINTKMGDSRKSGFDDDSASFLITSPPYINVFNYHQKYRKSVEALGFDVLGIAKSEIGANRKNRGNRLLTVIEYCNDMALSMYDSSKVLADGSRMIYVVGRESTVLGYSFCNSEIVYKLGLMLGFDFELRQERVFKNRYGQMIYEDILHFTSHKSNVDVLSGARNIARDILSQKFDVENKNSELLKDAYNKIDLVKVAGL